MAEEAPLQGQDIDAEIINFMNRLKERYGVDTWVLSVASPYDESANGFWYDGSTYAIFGQATHITENMRMTWGCGEVPCEWPSEGEEYGEDDEEDWDEDDE